jgi:hypothetical protein
VNDNLGSPSAGDTTLGVERLQPLFHLFNGDLCYASLAEDRVGTWWDFWENNSRSARKRPWMPSAGNQENELGNGPIGYQTYQTYFSVPATDGQTDVTRGLWYAFTAGQELNPTLTPIIAGTTTDVIDTSKGTLHMVIGGGGTSVPSNQLFFNPPQCQVITSVGESDPATGKRPPVYVKEQAPWSAVRNAAHS